MTKATFLDFLAPGRTFPQSVLLLALRFIYGGQFVLTGRGKLLNLDRTTKFFDSLQIPAPHFHAILVGCTEMIGGGLLVLGLGTRIACAPLIISMCVAYSTAEREAFQNLDTFTAAAPYQFLLACLIILAFGPGGFSLDSLCRGRTVPYEPSPESVPSEQEDV